MIDSMLFQGILPAGNYTAGQEIPMSLVAGPAVVRDGNGNAKLKRIFTVADHSGADLNVHITNGSWIDEVINPAPPAAITSMLRDSKNIQSGHDCPLVVNSQFSVKAKVINAATTTDAQDVFCQIDIEYDAVPAVTNPREETGVPMTIQLSESIPATVYGNPLAWAKFPKDVFKAGFKYLLTSAGMDIAPLGGGITSGLGFVSITGAAGQAGLQRIIPIYLAGGAMAYPIDYSTVLVKGPMDVNVAMLTSAAATATADLQLDFVRRG